MAEPLLETRNLSKSYYHVQALRGMDFAVHRHEVVGVMGENGAGKSTLLNLLSGVARPDAGQIRVGGVPVTLHSYREANRHGITRVFQEPALVPSLSVYENLYLTHEHLFGGAPLIRHRAMAERARSDLALLRVDVDPRTMVADLDLAARQLIEIAKAFALGALLGVERPVVLLDEPTSSLERHSVSALFDLIERQRQRASFVFVSHRLSETLHLCDRIYVLKDGERVATVTPDQVNEAKLHEMLVGRSRDADYYKEGQQKEHQGPLLLETRSLTAPGQFRDVTMQVHGGEILGIGGVLGSGKDRLGRALAGDVEHLSGEMRAAGAAAPRWNIAAAAAAGIGYLPEDREDEGIIGVLPVSWNISLASIATGSQGGSVLNLAREQALAREYIAQLRIKTPDPGTQAWNLSGGNQQKVVLAKWLAKHSRLVVLDNPTRGLDAGAKEEVYEVLRQAVAAGDRAVVLITDDLPELIGLSSRILVMKDRHIVQEVPSPTAAKPTEEQLVGYMV